MTTLAERPPSEVLNNGRIEASGVITLRDADGDTFCGWHPDFCKCTRLKARLAGTTTIEIVGVHEIVPVPYGLICCADVYEGRVGRYGYVPLMHETMWGEALQAIDDIEHGVIPHFIDESPYVRVSEDLRDY